MLSRPVPPNVMLSCRFSLECSSTGPGEAFQRYMFHTKELISMLQLATKDVGSRGERWISVRDADVDLMRLHFHRGLV